MKFADVLEIKNGRNQRQVECVDGRYPIYGSGGVMGRANSYICEANAVVIGRKGNINNPIFVDEPFWNVDTAFGLVPHADILLPKYLYYFCKSYNFEKLNTTVTIPSLTKLNLLQVEIDVPNLETQKERVNILDGVEYCYGLLTKEAAQLDELVKSRFVEMFGESRANPKGWNIIKLGQLADVGSSKRVFVEELRNDGIPFYRGTEVGALAEGQLITPELYITEQHYRALIKATGAPAKGDLLMPSICSDGRIWLVDTDAPFYFKDGRVLWIHPTSRELDSRYLQHVLKEKIMTDYSSIASGTTFAELKIFALKALCVIVPPLELQNQFSTFVAQVDKSKLAVKQSLEKLETLKKSLMQQYFG